MTNNKAYQMQLENSNNQNRVFKLTIEQLEYFKDSISLKLKEAKEELKIKDSKIEAMEYQSSINERVDTIRTKDTIFINSSSRLDTIIGDKWYQLKLGLYYPNTIVVNPKFINERIVIISSKKETINPPKKFFLFRWFQKKHEVIEVNIKENNPYVSNREQRYIQIIK